MTWGKLFYGKYLIIELVEFLVNLNDFIGNLRFILLCMIHRINKLLRCYLAFAVIDLGMFAISSFLPQISQ